MLPVLTKTWQSYAKRSLLKNPMLFLPIFHITYTANPVQETKIDFVYIFFDLNINNCCLFLAMEKSTCTNNLQPHVYKLIMPLLQTTMEDKI